MLCVKLRYLEIQKKKKKVSYFQFNLIHISFFFELERPGQISEGDDQRVVWPNGDGSLALIV
jgi:hypothetical protein